MKSVRAAFSICIQNIRKWKTDCRIWTIAALLLIMLGIYADDMHGLCLKLDADMPVWIFPFLYQQRYMKVIFSIPLVMLFCNAPFIDDNQTYVYVRSGRTRWLLGQLLYILASSALYYAFLAGACLLAALAYGGSVSPEWGSVLATASATNVAGRSNYHFIQVSSLVIRCFKPLQACAFTFLTSWSSAVLTGTLTFAVNYLSGQKYAGAAAASFLIVFSFFVEICSHPELIYCSPASWVTLDKIDVGGMTEYPGFTYCMLFYWISILALSALVFIFGRKREFDVRR